MKCSICNLKAFFTCPCEYLFFFETHLGSHYKQECKQTHEKLNISLEMLDLQNIKYISIERIKLLKASRQEISDLSKNLIKKIKIGCSFLLKKLNNQIIFYSKLINLQELSHSLKAEADRIIGTTLTIIKISLDIDQLVEKAFTKDVILIKSCEYPRNKIEREPDDSFRYQNFQGTKSWPII